jgi:cysteine desulfurase
MYANNEIGTVQPIAELAAIVRESGALFHTDAVQAPGWLPLDVKRLGVDLLSLSAHKSGGPKGVGILYVRSGTPLAAAIPGGGQEFGRRSGTENVAGVAGAAAALEAAVGGYPAVAARVGELRDRLERGLSGAIESVRINGRDAERLPAIANLSFAGVDAEAMLARLDLEGIAVSAGSACTSGTLEPSHVIRALGHDGAGEATIRFSLGAATTAAEIDRVLTVVPPAVLALRRAPAQA